MIRQSVQILQRESFIAVLVPPGAPQLMLGVTSYSVEKRHYYSLPMIITDYKIRRHQDKFK